MIDLYTWTTPNGRKVSILLEELGLPYTAHAIDISKGEQFQPDFLKISPNNRIPAIIDRDSGFHLMESGPMLGQVHHFVKYNKGKAPYAEERYLKEAHRLYTVLDRRLADREFVAEEYSIADIAIWPWISRYEWQTVELDRYPNVKRWYVAIARRPAVERGYHVPKKVNEIPMP